MIVTASAAPVTPSQSVFNNAANNGVAIPNESGSDASSETSRPVTETKSSKEAQNRNSVQTDREQLATIAELSKRDREVRAHEQAHASAGGRYAGAPSLSYQRGPDSRLYAVSGEVAIDTSPVPGDPQATLEKALTVQRAALAPVDPSAADRSIAAKAVAIAGQARAELLIENSDKAESSIAPPEKVESSSISEEEDTEGSVNLEQQLISSGAVTGNLPQGSFLDLKV